MSRSTNTDPGTRRSVAAHLLPGLVLAGAVVLEGLLAFGVWGPLHAAGWFQPVTGLLNALDHVLQLPGLVAAEVLGVRTGHEPTPASRAVGLLVNAGLY